MEIPLVSKEELEKEDEESGDIRDQTVEFMKGKGYQHLPAEEEFGDETSDFCIKGDQLVEMIIINDVDKEILGELLKARKE